MHTQGEQTSQDQILQPLDREQLVRRSIEIFPQAYLTNISIIQGVALSVFVMATVNFLADDNTTSELAIQGLAQSLLMLIGIITVSYEYLWFTTIMRWTPTFRDTAVPYALGVCEIVPLLLLGRPVAWWVSFAVFAAMGALAFTNTLSRIRPEMFPGHRPTFDDIRKLLITLISLSVATAATAGGAALLVSRFPKYQSIVSAISAATLAVLVLVLIVGYSELAINNLYRQYGVSRRPPLFAALRGTLGMDGREPSVTAAGGPDPPPSGAATETGPPTPRTSPDEAPR